ncbi:MAG: GreA/GreB family elongation factor [Dehalococcoidales bacterium]|nr:GreA/GreB family elongation factor [Dehalococcoidales bacterium]
MDNNNDNGMKICDAASCFVERTSVEDEGVYQQALSHLVRWFGKERIICEIMPPEIANYADRLLVSDAEYLRKLEIVKAFLKHAKKEGWLKSNLEIHLKIKKSKAKANNGVKKDTIQRISLTREGYDKVKKELEELKKKRPQAIEEVTKAAADKDFRENAPLDAARERLSHLEGKILELQELLKKAEIIDEYSTDLEKAGIGDSIILIDLQNKEQIEYTLVSSREFDPSKGKISGSSPLGKAILGKCSGETLEIIVPAGKLCYKIEKIEHTIAKHRKNR